MTENDLKDLPESAEGPESCFLQSSLVKGLESPIGFLAMVTEKCLGKTVAVSKRGIDEL